MLAAAPAKKNAHSEFGHHSYFKAAVSSQQSAVSSQRRRTVEKAGEVRFKWKIPMQAKFVKVKDASCSLLEVPSKSGANALRAAEVEKPEEDVKQRAHRSRHARALVSS